jgi:hypothetical protein
LVDDLPDWDAPLRDFSSRSVKLIAATLEEWFESL